MQSLVARQANLDKEYGQRIRELLSGGGQTERLGGVKHIEEVFKEERQSRSQNAGTPTKKGGAHHHDQAPMSKSSILSEPLPEKGTDRAILAGRLEMEKARLHDDLSTKIAALDVAQEQERAALHAAASEILQALSSKVRSLHTSSAKLCYDFFGQHLSSQQRCPFPVSLVQSPLPFLARISFPPGKTAPAFHLNPRNDDLRQS